MIIINLELTSMTTNHLISKEEVAVVRNEYIAQLFNELKLGIITQNEYEEVVRLLKPESDDWRNLVKEAHKFTCRLG